ncbi:MAG TPA: sensor histidine kinase [Streptosporangiaceae bacterium]|nr:sensor histidine kinase [Streptosporangiaceae bacterium]
MAGRRVLQAATTAGALAGGAAAVVGVLASVHTYRALDPWWVWVPVQVVGPSFTAAGVTARLRRPDHGIGWLMIAVGIASCAVDLRWSTQPALFAIGFSLFYLGPVIFTHLVLALPAGRLTTRPERLVTVGLYLDVLVTQPMRYLIEHPRPPQSWTSPDRTPSPWATAASVAGLALTLTAIWLVVSRWRAAGRPARRTHALTWVTGAVVGVIVTGSTSVSVLDAGPAVLRPFQLVYAFALIFTPFAVLAGVLRVRMARMRVADLVIQLDESPEPRALCSALADALGDPTLQVCFRLPGTSDYVDADGRPLLLPASGPAGTPATAGRAVTPVARHGELLAALIHDPDLVGQRPLVDAVVAAACLALENGRLHAVQRTQLEEVRASRARIVAAADMERQRIQRDLHDGVQNKLLTAAMLVGQAVLGTPGHALLEQAGTQLREALSDLRELTDGIHPPSLAGQGLAAVVENLAERAPIPVRFQVPTRRWPDDAERAAYFVINEALANVYKHAAATYAAVMVSMSGDHLFVDITDDGRGGANPGRGTGLRGLEDRVAALGGTLQITSSPGLGTQIKAELPCV